MYSLFKIIIIIRLYTGGFRNEKRKSISSHKIHIFLSLCLLLSLGIENHLLALHRRLMAAIEYSFWISSWFSKVSRGDRGKLNLKQDSTREKNLFFFYSAIRISRTHLVRSEKQRKLIFMSDSVLCFIFLSFAHPLLDLCVFTKLHSSVFFFSHGCFAQALPSCAVLSLFFLG